MNNIYIYFTIGGFIYEFFELIFFFFRKRALIDNRNHKKYPIL